MINNHMNYEWFIRKDLSEYSGKWLAIIDKQVVDSGKDVNKLIKDVKIKYPQKRPLITKVRDRLSIL
jgi:hypothetical protein